MGLWFGKKMEFLICDIWRFKMKIEGYIWWVWVFDDDFGWYGKVMGEDLRRRWKFVFVFWGLEMRKQVTILKSVSANSRKRRDLAEIWKILAEICCVTVKFYIYYWNLAEICWDLAENFCGLKLLSWLVKSCRELRGSWRDFYDVSPFPDCGISSRFCGFSRRIFANW